MDLDEISQSGIRRLADFSPYLDQLAGLAQEMGLSQRSNLVHLEKSLHQLWSLGQNNILSWAPLDDGLLVLVVPHYAIAEYTSPCSDEQVRQVSPRFITELISGDRQLSFEQMQKVARLLDVEPTYIPLRQPLSGHPVETQIIERMIRRYGINYVASRAVTLFDIVGFSLLTPFEQMTQLNSLSYSLNSAHAKMLEQDVGINFARSSSGDGFYVWNRDDGLEANVNLYHFMHIVLADNAIARSKSASKAVPSLRACFHVGSCYEFHQAEGLNPTMHDFIVGDVTIELARMIEAALPGQILVGEFLADIQNNGPEDHTRTQAHIDAVTFLERAQGNLAKLSGLEFSGERVTAIKCYLTGENIGGGQFTIRRLEIKDKHGLSRVAYNAKVNIYRETAQPILLGIEDRKLAAAVLPV
ncbi:MAG: helix-turn-helix transcriptional regulator [Gammaproteobacteria bacterium]|nr:helix-turn-helix transcriptional regulator [Gammaproteobacteria bacterium]